MSEKIEDKQVTITENIHHFYCDDCAKHLGCNKEHEDGYYHQIGRIEIQFYVPERGWRTLGKHLCHDCRAKFLTQLDDRLSGLGFKEGRP